MRKRKPCVCEEFIAFFFFFEFIAFNNSSDLTHQSLHKRTEILCIWSVLDLSGFNRETDATLYIPGMNALCVCVGGGGGGLVVGCFFFCPAMWHVGS